MDIVSILHEEIGIYKQQAVGILRHRNTDDQIKELCTRFVNAPEDADLQGELAHEGHPADTYFAVVALCCLMRLEVDVPPSADYHLTASSAADLIITAFNAMLSLTEAGWKPAEKLAISRQKQLMNQPAKRHHEQTEKQDIFDRLEEYIEERNNRFPKSLENFLAYLSNHGYEIDEKAETVDHSGVWQNKKAYKTIKNWMQEYRKKFPG